jgi:hypothetical protein
MMIHLLPLADANGTLRRSLPFDMIPIIMDQRKKSNARNGSSGQCTSYSRQRVCMDPIPRVLSFPFGTLRLWSEQSPAHPLETKEGSSECPPLRLPTDRHGEPSGLQSRRNCPFEGADAAVLERIGCSHKWQMRRLSVLLSGV